MSKTDLADILFKMKEGFNMSIALVEADRVEITSIIDNSIDLLLPSNEIAKRPPFKDDWFEDIPVIAEHGLSDYITIHKGRKRYSLLYDLGLTPRVLSHNAEALQLDFSTLDAILMSHGHIDHTGGFKSLKEKIGRRTPVILHPDAFSKRKVIFPDGTSANLPPPTRTELKDAGVEVMESREPSFLIDNLALYTGEVSRVTDFEKGLPIHHRLVNDKWEPDPLICDDQALIVNVRNKGLVVLTGCGHAGIINIVRQAQRLTGVEKIHALVGGLHLSGRIFEPIIPKTVDELTKISPKAVIPSHCTGWKAIHTIAKALPEAFIQNSVGTKYVF